MEKFNVSEWGIFRQEYNSINETYLNGPRPGKVPMPETVETVDCKPVIYFKGEGSMDLTVTVNMDARDIYTIPPVSQTGKDIQWNVKIAGDIYDEKDDAKVVTVNEEVYEYLFYEGIGNYPQNVIVGIDNINGSFWVSIQNIGTSGIYDAYLITEEVNGSTSSMGSFHIPEISPKEIFNGSLSPSDRIDPLDMRTILKERLLERGLEDNEAEDLLEYWIDGETDSNGIRTPYTLLEPRGSNNARLIFFIPQEEYDSMLPISFSKDPSSIHRVGIFEIKEIVISSN